MRSGGKPVNGEQRSFIEVARGQKSKARIFERVSTRTFFGNPPLAGRFAGSPIQALDLVRQECARPFSIYDHLEGVAFKLRGQRAADHQARLAVVDSGAQYQRGPVTRLFVRGLG